MRRPDGLDRATDRGSDQAPFSTANPPCLRCGSRFIVDHPTLPQALAPAAPLPSKFLSAPSSYRPILYPYAVPLAPHHGEPLLAQPLHHTAYPSDIPSQPLACSRHLFKSHNFVPPNRRGFLHSRRIETTAATPRQFGADEISLWPRCFRYGPRRISVATPPARAHLRLWQK